MCLWQGARARGPTTVPSSARSCPSASGIRVVRGQLQALRRVLERIEQGQHEPCGLRQVMKAVQQPREVRHPSRLFMGLDQFPEGDDLAVESSGCLISSATRTAGKPLPASQRATASSFATTSMRPGAILTMTGREASWKLAFVPSRIRLAPADPARPARRPRPGWRQRNQR